MKPTWTHIDLARVWRHRPGDQWWIIAKSGWKLAQKKMAHDAWNASNAAKITG